MTAFVYTPPEFLQRHRIGRWADVCRALDGDVGGTAHEIATRLVHHLAVDGRSASPLELARELQELGWTA